MIGKRVRRIEDPAMLRGKAQYVDDIHIPGTLHAGFVRSPYPHARVGAIDGTAAKAMAGVHAVYTLADLEPHMTARRLPLGFKTNQLPEDVTPYVLNDTEVCHVGEAVAVVIAESRYQAEDAAAMVEVDYDPLPSVAGCRVAAEEGAPRVHTERPSNILVEFGQAYGECAAAFERAAHVAGATYTQHRGGAHSIEGRGAIARYDRIEDRLTLWSSTQMSHEVRAGLVKMLGSEESRVRVVAPDVGGGFGAKYLMYSEELVVAVAARMLDRPVKWIEDRREHFVASIQEREQFWDMEIAVDGDGKILGVRGTMLQDQGAYTPQGINLPYNASTSVPGAYIVPAYDIAVKVVETNTVAAMPVRGAGYPEGNYIIERLLDAAAAGLGMDRGEIRWRNLITPEIMPYETPLKTRAGTPVKADSGDFPKCQAIALDAAESIGFPERQATARAAGRYLGFGLANGLKGTGRGPFESGIVRIERSGRVKVFTGALSIGQGIKTILAQIAAEEVGVDPSEIEVVCGDTGTIALGLGGFASRQTVTAGSSVHLAAREVREKLLKLAAHMLEAAPEDLEIVDGTIRVVGAPDLSVPMTEVAEAASGVPGYSLPEGIEAGLEANVNFKPPGLTYSNGVHAVEAEVDIETGEVIIHRYVVVSDCGRIVNPMLVDGQVTGGVVHGIGNALYEWMGYDSDGQPLTTTLADYIMPTAPELVRLDLRFEETYSPLNPLGVKGVGECGTVPAAAAVVSAIEDALSPFGIKVTDYPVTPPKIVAMIQAASV